MEQDDANGPWHFSQHRPTSHTHEQGQRLPQPHGSWSRTHGSRSVRSTPTPPVRHRVQIRAVLPTAGTVSAGTGYPVHVGISRNGSVPSQQRRARSTSAPGTHRHHANAQAHRHRDDTHRAARLKAASARGTRAHTPSQQHRRHAHAGGHEATPRLKLNTFVAGAVGGTKPKAKPKPNVPFGKGGVHLGSGCLAFSGVTGTNIGVPPRVVDTLTRARRTTPRTPQRRRQPVSAPPTRLPVTRLRPRLHRLHACGCA